MSTQHLPWHIQAHKAVLTEFLMSGAPGGHSSTGVTEAGPTGQLPGAAATPSLGDSKVCHVSSKGSFSFKFLNIIRPLLASPQQRANCRPEAWGCCPVERVLAWHTQGPRFHSQHHGAHLTTLEVQNTVLQGYSCLHRELQASLGYTRPCLVPGLACPVQWNDEMVTLRCSRFMH